MFHHFGLWRALSSRRLGADWCAAVGWPTQLVLYSTQQDDSGGGCSSTPSAFSNGASAQLLSWPRGLLRVLLAREALNRPDQATTKASSVTKVDRRPSYCTRSCWIWSPDTLTIRYDPPCMITFSRPTSTPHVPARRSSSRRNMPCYCTTVQ